MIDPAFQSRAQTRQTAESADSNSSLLPDQRDEVAEHDPRIWTYGTLPQQQYMHEIFWKFPDDTPAFFRDSLLQIVARTYYLNRENSSGTTSQAWAAGGWLAYRSGLFGDIFGVQAAVYTSQPLFAPASEGGTLLLTPDQNALNSVGQAYVRADILDQEFRGGRQLVNTPLINPHDNRMVPSTFEGITLDSLPDKERIYDYAIGYLADVKERDSNVFIPMSDALAGSNVANRGATFGDLKYRPLPGLSTIIENYYIQDFVDTGFAQVEYDFRQPNDRPNWIIGANIIDQRSVGSDLLTGTSFQTYQASAKVLTSYAGWSLFAAGSVTGDQSSLFEPFGSEPNYTQMQQLSFDNPGEKALGASVAYDFSHAFKEYGLAGLSAGVWDTQGWGATNPTTNVAIPSRNEMNLWLQYRPASGPLQGFRFKAQYSDVWQQGNIRNPQPELRLIVDYTVLFRPPTKQAE